MFVKAAKRGQDMRLDLPAVGPATIAAARRAQLAGLAIAAGEVLIADRPAFVKGRSGGPVRLRMVRREAAEDRAGRGRTFGRRARSQAHPGAEGTVRRRRDLRRRRRPAHGGGGAGIGVSVVGSRGHGHPAGAGAAAAHFRPYRLGGRSCDPLARRTGSSSSTVPISPIGSRGARGPICRISRSSITSARRSGPGGRAAPAR